MLAVNAAATAEEMQEDNVHVRTWNQFAQDVLRFHQQRISNKDVKVQETIGGYAHLPDFYIQKEYFLGGNHIATVMWEREKQEHLHSIEVFIHNKEGKVVRDYTAAFLPQYRNAPTQTLISFHRYNNGLHAFRSFDASGYRIVERCTGSYKGKEVNLLLDEDEIAEALADVHTRQGIMVSDDYQNCFGNLQQELGKYIKPQ
jgi:hypothetical protein